MKYISLIAVFLFFSCTSDIGNYNYKNLNELTIEGVNDQQVIDVYPYESNLEIKTKITGTKSGEDLSSFEYVWKLVPASSETEEGSEKYVISREKDLHYEITSLTAQLYYGVYIVKDKSSGMVFTKRFFVNVKDALALGWAILCEDDDNTPHLDWIHPRAANDDVISLDLWRDYKADYKQRLGRPLSIEYSFVTGKREDYRLVNFEKGSYNLVDTTMEVSESQNMRYRMGRVPEQVHIRALTPQTQSPSSNMFIDKDGNLFKKVSLGGDVFDLKYNAEDAGKPTFRVAPFYTHNTWNGFARPHCVILYDQDNCRFMEMRNGGSYLKVAAYANASANIFEPTTNKEMVYMESRLDAKSIAILKDKTTGKFSVYGFITNFLTGSQLSNTTQSTYNELTGPDIEKATCFAYDKLNNYLFYAAGENVYRFVLVKKGTEVDAQKVLSFPGEVVVKLKYKKLQAFRTKPSWELDQQNDLHIASNKTTGPSENMGIIRSYGVPAREEALVLKKDFSNKGISKIIDMAYFEK